MRKLAIIMVLYVVVMACYGQSARKWMAKGQKEFDRHDYYDAIFCYTIALGKNPKLAEVWYFRGMARRALDEENSGRVIILDTARHDSFIRRKSKKNVTGASGAAVSCQYIDHGKIIDSLNHRIQGSPGDAGAWFSRGKSRFFLQDYKGSVADFTRTLEIDSAYPDARLNRGLAKDRLGDYNGAITDFTKAIELNPTSAEAWLYRSFARGQNHDSAGSQADLGMATGFDDGYEVVPITVTWTAETHDCTLEIYDYTMAISLKPGFADAYCRRGLAEIRMKQKENGCSDLQKAAELGNKEAAGYLMKYCK
jgi:tetratricopeptide (TPR) repeat protein